MIEAWRSTPALLPSGTNGDLVGKVFPSGRQVLCEIIRQAGLSRSDRIAVPEWSSACLLGAVSTFATPVSMPDAFTAATPPRAVVIYDQWGWPRQPQTLKALLQRWPEAFIIHDTVDTADFDMAPPPIESLPGDRLARLWSLSKVLGLSGGGLGCFGAKLMSFTPELGHREMAELLARAQNTGHLAVDIAKTWLHCLPPDLQRTVESADLRAAFRAERSRRQENLLAVRDTWLAAEWPAWLQSPIDGLAPGLCPILRGQPQSVLDSCRTRISGDLGINLPCYHFEFSGDPLNPSYEKCLALPLHGQVTPDAMNELATLAGQLIRKS